MYTIVRREAFSDTTFLWEVSAPDVAKSALPGHFVMLRLGTGAERIPLTVADYDREKGTITMVIQALGKTTRQMLTDYKQGDTFEDFVGPLGLPQHIEKVGHVVLVGGGLGVAPVYPQLKAFKEAGNRVTGIIGFRNKDLVFWEKKFAEYCDDLIVCTDDGSYGKPGFVTQALKEVCEKDKPAMVVAIGPLPMMNACVETTRPFGVKTMVSLNAIMVDGTGMCGSCRVTVDKNVKFACVDGPDFDGHLVDFKELLSRQKRFKAQETRATEDYAHVCNLEKQLFEENRHNYKKIKDLAPKQTVMPERDHVERARNFKEVNLGYSLQDALGEAERCIQCAKPTCISGCPVQIDIPRFIKHLVVRDIDGALEVIREASIFPSVCGRVCPQETQCEAQCVIAKKVESVGIGRLERFVGDNGKLKPTVPPRFAPADKLGKVAVCGSGPAGLAVAADLVKFGCDVTVYEALHVVGGVLRYGIPSFRLPRDIIDREVNNLVEMGVKIETNKVIGKTFTVPQLMTEKGYDAVFLGVGAGAPAFLGIPGEFAGQVYSANEFLTRVNLMGGDKFPFQDTPVSIGKSAVIIGAGNTAMDCLRVAKRLGTETVRCVYRRTEKEAPARIEEIRHAKEEGIEFFFLHSPVEIYTDADGNVKGMKVEEMELGEPDEKGRRKPVATGRFKDLECDTVIYALGTKANPIITQSTPGLTLNKWGNIQADDGKTQTTSLQGVFAGGDIVTGGATVILAMGAGRRAAKSIGAYLKSGKQKWPITEEDMNAFVPPTPLGAAGATATGPQSAAATGKVCPKCRQPLEGDEEYVCCATAQLTWKCQDCAKVSEGFAFPYGMCPACGGKLAVADPAKAADAAALDAVRIAFEIELGGQAFYGRASREAPDPLLRDLFGRMAEMEKEHMATLSRRYHAQMPAPGDFKVDRAAIYAGIPNRPEDPANLFRIAIAFEERAVKFFTERGEAAAAGSPEKQLYKELAAEEKEHVALLTTELARWQEGKPGLI